MRGAIGYAAHGIGFLLLAGAALAHFGALFGVLAAGIAGLGVLSLKQAWASLCRHRDRGET